MILHLLKLVWNRKRANALIVAEIFICFLVLFAVLTGAIAFASNWRLPLGFRYDNVWDVRADVELESMRDDAKLRDAFHRLVQEAKTFPEVEAAAASNTPPYAFSTSAWTREINGKVAELIVDEVTDEYAKVMGMNVADGRWFNAEDDAAQIRPVVLDENAARAIFGTVKAAGRTLAGGKDDPPFKVVGVVPGYRKDGETMSPVNMMFLRYGTTGRFEGVVRNLMVRVRPGTPAQFEEQLVARLQAVAPEMSFRVRHLDQMRTESLRIRLAPLVIGAIICAFLLAMVALGLTGVLWQNVTKRTREIGLRRAMGASGSSVNGQVLAEVVLLASIALVIGSVVVLQLPILGAFALVSKSAFLTGFFAALATIYALTVLCGLYPSWLASRLQPADALRYE